MNKESHDSGLMAYGGWKNSASIYPNIDINMSDGYALMHENDD